MSRNSFSLFFPSFVESKPLFFHACKDLELKIEFTDRDSEINHSASLGLGGSRLLFQWSDDAVEEVEEIYDWESPGEFYKVLLKDCSKSVYVQYHDLKLAKDCVRILFKSCDSFAGRIVFFNDKYGCLLTLLDVYSGVTQDPAWTWERSKFPELPQVGPSEFHP